MYVTQTPRTNCRSPFPLRFHMKFAFDMPSELVIFENGGQRADYDDGRTTDHGYTIYKSINEPKGSGELKSTLSPRLDPLSCMN